MNLLSASQRMICVCECVRACVWGANNEERERGQCAPLPLFYAVCKRMHVFACVCECYVHKRETTVECGWLSERAMHFFPHPFVCTYVHIFCTACGCCCFWRWVHYSCCYCRRTLTKLKRQKGM